MSIFASPTWTGSWPGSGFGQEFLQDNPGAAWQKLLDQLLGVQAASNPKEQFYQREQQNWFDRYMAGAASGGTPWWSDFLQQNQGGISGAWDNASSQERGQPTGGGIGRARWVGFPT